jgi:hypothetical protein
VTQSTTAGALLAFCRQSYPISTHLGHAGFWVIAFDGALALVRGEIWRIGVRHLLAAVVLFLLMLALRCVDEIKDLGYDRIHHPARPLASGVVGTRQVGAIAAIAGGLALLLLASASLLAAGVAAAVLTWAAVMLWLEQSWQRVRSDIALNTLLSHLIHVGQNAVLWSLYLGTSDRSPSINDLAVLLLFSLGFFHFEIARKARWPEHLAGSERSYVRSLGAAGQVVALTATAGLAALLSLWIARAASGPPQLLLLRMAGLVPAALAAHAVFGFVRGRRTNPALRAHGVRYFGTFYQTLALQAFAAEAHLRSIVGAS